jgi:hypothetical protein
MRRIGLPMKHADNFIILHKYPDPDLEKAWRDCLAQVETPAHYDAPEFFLEPYWEGLRPFAVLAVDHGNVVSVMTGIHSGRAVDCGLSVRPQVCIAKTAAGSAAAEALARGLLAEAGSANLISVYTWHCTSFDSFKSYGFGLHALGGSVVLDLTVGPQALLKQFDENRRRNIRLAMKNKVEVQVASTSEEIRAVYEIYRAWRHTPRKKIEGKEVPFAWFEQACRLTTNRRVLLARYEGRVIAGLTLRFYRGGLLEFSNSSALEEYLRVRPHDLLQWRAIEWGCKEGFQRYSLCGTDPFLRRFGGTVVPIDRYRLDRTWLRRHDLQEAVLDAGQETLQRMPKPVEKTVRRVLGKAYRVLRRGV